MISSPADIAGIGLLSSPYATLPDCLSAKKASSDNEHIQRSFIIGKGNRSRQQFHRTSISHQQKTDKNLKHPQVELLVIQGGCLKTILGVVRYLIFTIEQKVASLKFRMG